MISTIDDHRTQNLENHGKTIVVNGSAVKNLMAMVGRWQNHWKTIDGNGGLKKIILPSHRWEKMIIVQVYAIQYNNIHYHSIPSIPYNSCKMTRQHHFGYNSRILNNWAGLLFSSPSALLQLLMLCLPTSTSSTFFGSLGTPGLH